MEKFPDGKEDVPSSSLEQQRFRAMEYSLNKLSENISRHETASKFDSNGRRFEVNSLEDAMVSQAQGFKGNSRATP